VKFVRLMLLLISILIFSPGDDSRAQSGEAVDTETEEDVATSDYEPGDKSNFNLTSTPKSFYHYSKSHNDGGLVFESKNGNFRIRPSIRIQYQFSVTDNNNDGGTVTESYFRRIRLRFDGHAFRPWLKYLVQFSRDNVRLDQNSRGGIELKDAYIDAVYFKKIFPRIGQFMVPFNREQLTSSANLLLVERSIANKEFAVARDRGAALYGILGNHIVYGAGVFIKNGVDETEEGTAVGDGVVYAGRIQSNFGGTVKYGMENFPIDGDYKLVPDFTKKQILVFGAALVGIPDFDISNDTSHRGALDKRFTELGIVRGGVVSIAADASYKQPMYNVEAAYLGRWIDPDEGGGGTVYDQGLRIQTGVFFVPDFLEMAGRWSYIFYDTSPEVAGVDESLRDTSMELTYGINVFFSKNDNLKLQLSYSFINNTFTQGASDMDQKVLRIQFQVIF